MNSQRVPTMAEAWTVPQEMADNQLVYGQPKAGLILVDYWLLLGQCKALSFLFEFCCVGEQQTWLVLVSFMFRSPALRRSIKVWFRKSEWTWLSQK